MPGFPRLPSQGLEGGRASNPQQQRAPHHPRPAAPPSSGTKPRLSPWGPWGTSALPARSRHCFGRERRRQWAGSPRDALAHRSFQQQQRRQPFSVLESSPSCHLHREVVLKDSSIFSLAALSPVPVLSFHQAPRGCHSRRKLLTPPGWGVTVRTCHFCDSLVAQEYQTALAPHTP